MRGNSHHNITYTASTCIAALTLEITAVAILYTTLSAFGVPDNTNRLIAAFATLVFVLIGLLITNKLTPHKQMISLLRSNLTSFLMYAGWSAVQVCGECGKYNTPKEQFCSHCGCLLKGNPVYSTAPLHINKSRTRRAFLISGVAVSSATLVASAILMLGNLTQITNFSASAPVHNLSAQRLPDPPDQIDTGPALSIIPSGTTTLHIDNNNLPLETDKVFTVNQTFYVTYTVQPPAGQQGQVSAKWYMNGRLYQVVTSDVINGDKTSHGIFQMQYLVPAEGRVEVYWNDQLALRFYFVVQSAN
jgi:hypothetical protein